MIKNKDYVPVAKVEEGMFDYGRRRWKNIILPGRLKVKLNTLKEVQKVDLLLIMKMVKLRERELERKGL